MAADLACGCRHAARGRRPAGHARFQLHRGAGVAQRPRRCSTTAPSAGCATSRSTGMSRTASTRLRLKNWKTSSARRRRRARQFRQPLAALPRMVLRPDRRPVGAAVRPARRSGVRNRCGAQPRLPLGRRRQLRHELRLLSRHRPPAGILWRGRHAGAGQPDDRLHAWLHGSAMRGGRPQRSPRSQSRTIRSTANSPATGASRRCPGWRAASSMRSSSASAPVAGLCRRLSRAGAARCRAPFA